MYALRPSIMITADVRRAHGRWLQTEPEGHMSIQ
jgi:hypothetical protein